MTALHRASTFLKQLSSTISKRRSILNSANIFQLGRNRTQIRQIGIHVRPLKRQITKIVIFRIR